MQISGLGHCLSNCRRMLLQLANHCRVIEDAAWDLAVPSTQPQYQMECRFFLDVVVRKSAAIFKLLSCKDETLLIRGDTFLILDLGLDVVDCVTWFDIKGDGLTSKSFNKNLKQID